MSRAWEILVSCASWQKFLSWQGAAPRAVAQVLLLTFTSTALMMPLPQPFGGGVAWAQEPDRPTIGIVPFARKGEVGVLAAARIEEYLRQMLSAGDALRPLPARVIDSGKPVTPIVREVQAKPQSPALKALDRADTLASTARQMIEDGEDPGDTLKLLKGAAQRYEDHFIELVDFTKLVDVYSQAATVSLKLNDPKAAKDWLEKAVVLQPTFVVDTRKASKPLQKALTEARQELADKEGANLSVDCPAPDAEVFVDGVKIGNCPSQIKDLLQGTHYVQVRKSGAAPWGEIFVAKGKDGALTADLKMEEEATAIGMTIAPEDIKAFAGSGNFQEKAFKNLAAAFSKQVGAQYLLYGVVSKSARTLELHLFLFNAKTKQACAMDKVDYQPTLGDLQMKTLDSEGRVRAALTTCKEVTELPAVFDAGQQPKAEPEEVVAPIPAPVDEVPLPRKATPEPKVRPVVKAPPPVEAEATSDANADPYAGLLHDEDETQTTPWYKKWWPWTIAGVLVAGGVGAIVYASTRTTPAATGFSAVGIVP